ncbi:MAG: ribonuclease E inhibitor RraB [Demequinaceae bacterium]|nr:ribonuclease E inhibitor RraB [Demequinaceae bacterium]
MGILDDLKDLDPEKLLDRSEVDGIRYRDLRAVGQLEKMGAALETPRRSTFRLSFTDKDPAHTVALALREKGLEVRMGAPGEESPQWSVVGEARGRALIPGFLRDTIDLCEALASTHDGEYIGWEANLTDEEFAAVATNVKQ